MFRARLFPLLVLILLLNACSGGSSSSAPPAPVADSPPIANAGPDQSVPEKTSVSLAGSGSDKEGAVSLAWTQTSGPAVSLSNASSANPVFSAPEVSSEQVLVFTLTVTDSAKQTATDSVSITIKDVGNADSLPTAHAGPDQVVNEKSAVSLSGSGNDKEGPVSFAWTQTSGPAVSLSNANSATASFTAPEVSSAQNLVFLLTVTDSAKQTATDSVTIAVSDVPDGGGGAPGDGYLFFFEAGNLYAVAPDAPSTIRTIEGNRDVALSLVDQRAEAAVFQAGQYNAANRSVSGLQDHSLIYSRGGSNGRLYKVSARKNGSLTPVQVSNANTGKLCGAVGYESFTHASDFADPARSQYLFELPGADGQCNSSEVSDDQWWMVRLGMGGNEAAIAAKPPLAPPFYDAATGAISAWLIYEGFDIKHCNADFAQCKTVGSSDFRPILLVDLGLNRYVFNVSGRLRVYDGNSQTLSASLHTVQNELSRTLVAVDTSHFYFVDGQSLLRASTLANAAATVLHTETAKIQRLVLAGTQLFYLLGNNSDKLRSLSVTGGSPQTVSTASSLNGELLELLFARHDKVYFNRRKAGTVSNPLFIAPLAAGVIDAQGQVSETANAAWIGNTFPQTHALDRNASMLWQPEKMIRTENNSANFSSATLRVVDAATATAELSLGKLPTDDNLLMPNCFGQGLGNTRLCSLFFKSPGTPMGFQWDVSLIGAATADSHARLTQTTSKSEIPVQ